VFARYYAHMWRQACGKNSLNCDIGKCVQDKFENMCVRNIDLADLKDNNNTRLGEKKDFDSDEWPIPFRPDYMGELRDHGISTVDVFMLSDFSWIQEQRRKQYYQEIQDKHRERIVQIGPRLIMSHDFI
jgi:hypothetical protein